LISPRFHLRRDLIAAISPQIVDQTTRIGSLSITALTSVQSSKTTELESLNHSRWRLMGVDPALQQIKRRSKYFADRRCVVTDNRQAVAPFRTV